MTTSSGGQVATRLVDAYYETPHETLLAQGDLVYLPSLARNLEPVRGTKSIVGEVYPYFFGRYDYAIVLNANCDIASENSREPKVSCVQLAAVVRATDHVPRSIRKYLPTHEDGHTFISKSNYDRAFEKLGRIVNCQEKTYFYLPKNRNVDIEVPLLVRLDTSVSFRIDDAKSYRSFLQSRLVTLRTPYKSKLGEKFADLFSRTGLDDVRDLVEDYLHWLDLELGQYCIPLPDTTYERAQPELSNLAKLDEKARETRLVEIVKAAKEAADKQEHPAITEIRKIVNNAVKPKIAETIMQRVERSAIFKELAR